MPTETKNPEVTPYDAYALMIQDYAETREGSLGPTVIEGESETNTDPLKALRENIGYFALNEAEIPHELLARDLGMDPEVLLQELERDERLIEKTREVRERLFHPSTPETQQNYATIDLRKIKWLSIDEERVQIQAEIVNIGDMTYKLVDLSPLHKVTEKAENNLRKAGKLSSLLDTLRTRSIPVLAQTIKQGGGADIRPVADVGSKDPEKIVKTDYPAYKFGINGSQNRAIVLLLGEEDGIPVYGLGAIYDHEDQNEVLRAISLGDAASRK